MYAVKFKNINIKWVAEAIDAKLYSFEAYNKKDIDVLELGRRYELYHNSIKASLGQLKIKHLYVQRDGKIIFADRRSFLNGLARTKISVCVPSSISHPEIAGNISTVALRYLQSMASKCLILGYMPDEMKYLFDYNPIIIIDMENPVTQIQSILQDYDSYIPLIEKNYQYLLKHHTWDERIKTMNLFLT